MQTFHILLSLLLFFSFFFFFNDTATTEIYTLSLHDALPICAWRWPGNVRELRNVIERAMIFSEGPVLRQADLPAVSQLDGGPARAHESTTFALAKRLSLADAEREYIRLTLEETGGDIQRAAEVLGISRKNLWEKRKKYGLIAP